MKFLRSALWYWLILYLLFNEFRILYCLSIVLCITHHLYFNYSKTYTVVLFSLLLFTIIRIETRPYRLYAERSEFYQGYVIEVKEYGAIVGLENFRKVLVYDIHVDLGDQIIVYGTLGEIDSLHNYGLFDYQTYMNQIGIYQYVQSDYYEVVSKSYSFSSLIYRYVQSLPIASLVNQFLYGYSENTKLDIFFSTGMHFSFLIHHILKVCSFFMTDTKIKWFETCLTALLFICFPNELSLFRLLVFSLLKWHRWKGISKLSIGMMILLFIYPECYSSLSFVVPFTLSLSFYFLKQLPRFISNKLVLLPIQLVVQYEVNILWILFFDLFKLLFSLDFMIMLVTLFFPFHYFILLANGIYSFLVGLYEYVSFFDVGLIIGKASLLVCIIYLFGLFLLHESKVGWYLIVCSTFIYFISIYGNPFIKISFLDVGQGDCMVVEYPFHQGIVMVDTGGGMRDNLASQVLIPYIKSRGYNSLDLLIISHHDEDHDGAMDDLMSQMNVKHSIDYDNMPNSIRINQYDIHFLDIVRHGDDENNKSIVTLFEFNNCTLLTAGDLNTVNEEQLLREYPNLSVDYLKLSHHGSSTSSSLYYLSRINPKAVFNSSGRNNVYQHPSYEVLNTLDRLGIPLYDTQEKGSIHLYIFKSISFILSAIEGE